MRNANKWCPNDKTVGYIVPQLQWLTSPVSQKYNHCLKSATPIPYRSTRLNGAGSPVVARVCMALVPLSEFSQVVSTWPRLPFRSDVDHGAAVSASFESGFRFFLPILDYTDCCRIQFLFSISTFLCSAVAAHQDGASDLPQSSSSLLPRNCSDR